MRVKEEEVEGPEEADDGGDEGECEEAVERPEKEVEKRLQTARLKERKIRQKQEKLRQEEKRRKQDRRRWEAKERRREERHQQEAERQREKEWTEARSRWREKREGWREEQEYDDVLDDDVLDDDDTDDTLHQLSSTPSDSTREEDDETLHSQSSRSSSPLSDMFFSASDDSDEEPPYRPARGRHRRAVQPGTDDDPDPPSRYDPVYPADRYGWSRNMKKNHVHKFLGPLPQGPTLERPEIDMPLLYFLSFFPVMLFRKMAKYTNIAGRSNQRFTKLTTAEEMKAWVGIRMIQGVHRNTSYEDDWSTDPSLRNPGIAATMTRGRFALLSEVISCANPTKGPHRIKSHQQRWAYMKAHPLYPLQVVWDTVVANCLANWNPSKQLAIHECMVKYKGNRANVKQFFIPLKPVKMGFKIYAVCESTSGYLLNMMVHSKSGQKTKAISMKVMEPFLDLYHELYCDNLFTSVALATNLLERKTYICGAVNRSSKGLPDDFSVNPRINPTFYKKVLELRKAPRGTMYSRQNDKFTAVQWKDTKVVSLLSSCHQAYRDKNSDFLQRKIKEHGEKTVTKKSVRAPPQAVAYTRHMGGVDRNDQYRSYQSCSRHSVKWWMKILYFLIDVSRVNAWLCYKHNNSQPGRQISHRLFTVKVANSLIAGFAEGTPAYQPLSQPVPRQNGPRHQLVRMPSIYGRMCVRCHGLGVKTPGKKNKITRYGCMSCNIHLCKGHCFIAFHSAEGVDVHE